MFHKGFIGAAASALLVSGAIAAPAAAADGVARNQAALGVAGHATPAMKACAKAAKSNVRVRCAVANGANGFQDDDSSGGGSATGWIVAAGALGAVALGVVAATSGDDDADDTGAPVSS